MSSERAPSSEAFEDGTQVLSEETAAAANAFGQAGTTVAGTFSPAAGQATMLARRSDGPLLITCPSFARAGRFNDREHRRAYFRGQSRPR